MHALFVLTEETRICEAQQERFSEDQNAVEGKEIKWTPSRKTLTAYDSNDSVLCSIL